MLGLSSGIKISISSKVDIAPYSTIDIADVQVIFECTRRLSGIVIVVSSTGMIVQVMNTAGNKLARPRPPVSGRSR